jgi:hypothetical protein
VSKTKKDKRGMKEEKKHNIITSAKIERRKKFFGWFAKAGTYF